MPRPVRRRSSPNRSTKRTHADCTSGLCRACKWNTRRVPRAWLDQPSGTPYPCKSKVIGREVTLRGDPRPSKVVGCATPLGETVHQHGRRKRAYQCQSAFVVRSEFGRGGSIETPVPRSVVTARMRHAKDVLCPDASTYGSSMRGYTRSVELDAARAKVHPFDRVADIPFPHRIGSTPCCENSPVSPHRLDALYAAWQESGEESDFDVLARSVRRALPKHLRATSVLESRLQIQTGIRAIRDHCWSMWLEKEARVSETSKSFHRRIKASRKSMNQMDLPATRGRRGRSVSTSHADEQTFLRRADMVSRNQFFKRDVAEQRRIVVRVFKRARKSLTFNPALHADDDLLAMASHALSRGEAVRR